MARFATGNPVYWSVCRRDCRSTFGKASSRTDEASSVGTAQEDQEDGEIMSDLVVIGFDDEHKAFEMRAALARLQKEYLIDMEDVVVVTKDEKGKTKLHQAANLTAAGAVSGTFWGMLIGMIFLNPLLGAALGAGAGALSGKLSDIGVSDNFMKQLGETLTPSSSAIFVLIRKATPDKVLEELKGFRGRVLKTSLALDKEEELRAVLERA
jgi:uncharacterized membrane protein